MVIRSPALDTIRDTLIRTGGGYLRNTRHLSGTTCDVCFGVTREGYSRCFDCHSRQTLEVADRLGIVSYAWSGHQTGHTMHSYKARPGSATTRELLSNLLTYAAVAHKECMTADDHSSPDSWAYVPSLRGRTGRHPLRELIEPFLYRINHIEVSPSDDVREPRSCRPENFTTRPAINRHVLLFDDTWTAGGHVQSVAGALKRSGASRVTTLVAARWLKPDFADTKGFISKLTSTFDPDVCPFTGKAC